MEEVTNPGVIMLFSGGRDSSLGAIRLSKKDYCVKLLFCNHQCIEHYEYANSIALELSRKFDRIDTMNPVDTTAVLYDLLHIFMTKKVSQCEMSHIMCLCCRSAMIVGALIMAKIFKCNTIATGDLRKDPYLFNDCKLRVAFDDLCLDYGIALTRPVDDIESKHDRIVELAAHGVFPKVKEPKCWMGFDAGEVTADAAEYGLEMFNAYMIPIMRKHYEIGVKAV